MIWIITHIIFILLILNIKKISRKISYMINTIYCYVTIENIIYNIKHSNPPYETLGMNKLIITLMILIYLLMISMCYSTIKIPNWINPKNEKQNE